MSDDPESTVRTTIRELIATQIGIASSGIADDDRIQEDLGLDSTDAAELVVTLNERHGLSIDLEQMEGAATVGDLVALAHRAAGADG